MSKSGYLLTARHSGDCLQPLINIAGRAMLFWLIDRLELSAADTLFVAISEAVDNEFHLGMQLSKEYPKLNIKMVPLKFDTRGAAETLFIACQSMSDSEVHRRTVSLDCDTIYVSQLDRTLIRDARLTCMSTAVP